MPDEATNVWDEVPDWGGVGARRLVRSPAGSLGATLWEFQPGGSQFVYHFHHGSEELLVVLSGEPTVGCTVVTAGSGRVTSCPSRLVPKGDTRSVTRVRPSPGS